MPRISLTSFGYVESAADPRLGQQIALQVEGSVLRVEAAVNCPEEFKVYQTVKITVQTLVTGD